MSMLAMRLYTLCACACACPCACACSPEGSATSAGSFENGAPEGRKSTPERAKMPPWRSSGASWAAGGAQVATKAALRPPLGGSWVALGGSWGRLGAVLGRSWRLLGPSWASRGAPGNHFGLPGVSLESFLALYLELPWKIAQTLKNLDFSMFFKVFSPPGGSNIHPKSFPNRSRRPLGGRWRPKKHPRAANRDQKEAKSAPRAPQGPKSAPQKFPEHFLPFSKPNPHPGGGGCAVFCPSIFAPFS